MALILPTLQGRGAGENPRNRFETLAIEADGEVIDEEGRPIPQTIYLKDTSRSIIASNNSPDIGFSFSINPYRGCEHGCIYCYARPTHEYLGFSAGLDFESRIMVKEEAPALLRKALCDAKWSPAVVAMSGVTDCYQPVERKLELTRKCLAVLAEFRNPVVLITKNHLITRDVDILSELASFGAVAVMVSVTTLDADLARRMEPRTSAPRRRLDAIKTLADAGIPAGVMVAPIVPGLTDHEAPAILKAAAEAGAKFAGKTIVRLPLAVAPLFEQWLERHYPDRKDKVLHRIRSMRGGKLNDSDFHTRMKGEGIFAEQISSMFKLARRRAGLEGPFPRLAVEHFHRPAQAGEQGRLFE